MNPSDNKYDFIETPGSVTAADVPVAELSRVFPRQISTGTQRGVQRVGYAGDRLDAPNNRFVLSSNSRIIDVTDHTKELALDISGFTTGTTNTIAVPDISDTLVTLTAIQTLTNKTLTSPTITFAAYSTFTPAPTGYSGSPTVSVARYLDLGKLIIMDIAVTGTSNATTLTLTLPVAAKSAANYPLVVTDNSVAQTDAGLLTMAAGSTTATLYATLASGAWTNANTKAFKGYGITYEAN